MKTRKKPLGRRRLYAGKKTLHQPTGGPIKHKLWLTTPGTLTFRLHGQRGFYDQNMVWQEV